MPRPLATRVLATRTLALLAAALAAAALPPLAAQAGAQAGTAPPGAALPRSPGFFDSEEPLEATLTTNLKQIRGDRKDGTPWRAATLSWAGPDGSTLQVPLRVRTRGHWRLEHCHFPPLRLNFTKNAVRGSRFDGLDRPKLVNYCRDDDPSEQYVLQEYQLYRVQQLLTPLGHRARLMRVTYADSASGKPLTTRWAFLIEEPEVMAERLGGKLTEQRGATVDFLDPGTTALVGVFEYLIGNTDFSVSALHNIELLQKDGTYLPIAYDFDHAGAVNARYAKPNEQLPIRRVRDRLFRGYCIPAEHYPPVFALFNEKKDALYALYADSIGRLMDPDVVKKTLEYYDEFYRTINDPRAAKRLIVDACLK